MLGLAALIVSIIGAARDAKKHHAIIGLILAVIAFALGVIASCIGAAPVE